MTNEKFLPCPYCGKKPDVSQYYYPPTVMAVCSGRNTDVITECEFRWAIEVSAKTKRNPGENETYTPLFEDAYEELLAKWNRMASVGMIDQSKLESFKNDIKWKIFNVFSLTHEKGNNKSLLNMSEEAAEQITNHILNLYDQSRTKR